MATSITAFLGVAEKGDVNVATTLTSFGDYLRAFGGFGAVGRTYPMAYAIRDFFLNGGGQAIAVRIYKNPAPPPAAGGGAPPAAGGGAPPAAGGGAPPAAGGGTLLLLVAATLLLLEAERLLLLVAAPLPPLMVARRRLLRLWDVQRWLLAV